MGTLDGVKAHVVKTRLCPHRGHLFATDGEGQKRHRHLASEANASVLSTSQESHIPGPTNERSSGKDLRQDQGARHPQSCHAFDSSFSFSFSSTGG